MKVIEFNKTKYVLTEKAINMQTWKWGQKRTRSIKYEDINSIYIEVNANKSGNIQILPNTKFEFRVRGLLLGESFHYPKIEYVDDIEMLSKKIMEQIKKVKNSA